MKLYRAEMGGIAPWLWMSSGSLDETRLGWTQQPDHWTLFFLEHGGGFALNNRTYPFEDGYAALVAPGAKAGFLRVGEGTRHLSFTFSLTKRIEVVALPALADLGDRKEIRRREARDAEAWLSRSIGRGLSFAYNLLWDIALPPDALRTSSMVHEFETLVVERLREKLSVANLAAELGVSQSHLLRLVRAEHGGTVQEFIRDKRAEIARNLIVTSDEPLKAIAMRTGMPDLQYFNKAIRTASGLSPRALRTLAQNRTPQLVVSVRLFAFARMVLAERGYARVGGVVCGARLRVVTFALLEWVSCGSCQRESTTRS